MAAEPTAAMTLIAHVSGVPVEELVAPLASGGVAMWFAARAWAASAVPRGNPARPRPRRTPAAGRRT
jgi:ribosomal protein L12E/L44/L45/RPP1/RPP2